MIRNLFYSLQKKKPKDGTNVFKKLSDLQMMCFVLSRPCHPSTRNSPRHCVTFKKEEFIVFLSDC